MLDAIMTADLACLNSYTGALSVTPLTNWKTSLTDHQTRMLLSVIQLGSGETGRSFLDVCFDQLKVNNHVALQQFRFKMHHVDMGTV